jgi:AcrR family transcriptional regulator
MERNDTTESNETRRAIVDAARTRFLHYGFKKTTIDEIAADAGVGKGTVYLYFPSKEDILLTIAREVKRNTTDQMRAIAGSLASSEEKLRRMLLASILSVHDAAMSASHGLELVDEILRPQIMRCGAGEREAQMQLLAVVLDEGARRGEFGLPGDDALQTATYLTLAMLSFYPPYLNPCHASASCRNDLEQRATAMLEFVLQGLRHR